MRNLHLGLALALVQAAPLQAVERWSENYSVPSSPSAPAGRAGAAQAAGSPHCVPGKPVSVLYGGQWYPARVLEGPDRMGTCLVSYDGFGANWDERVGAARIRAATTVSAPPAAADEAASAGGTASVPPGRYSCYTFDAGQLNYARTDVVIESGGRYSVGGKGGRYTLLQDGAMSFTGTMANATGRFSVKSGGRPQIELVFNGDARASMACSRGR